jgi:hypothetical protein
MLSSARKRALAGAYALVLAFASNHPPAFAQPVLQPAVDFDPANPVQLDIWAEVANTIVADVMPPETGTWGVIRSNVPGEHALLTLNPGGTQSSANNGGARAVQGGPPGSAGSLLVNGAFPLTPINVTLQNAVDLVCAACTVGNPALELIIVTAEMTPPVIGTAGTDPVLDVLVPANNVIGQATTDAMGTLSVNFGATMRTTIGAAPYETGTYIGTFDVIMQY